MSKKNGKIADATLKRPKRAKLSAQESLQRMQTFDDRKELFIAAIRKGKNRGLSS